MDKGTKETHHCERFSEKYRVDLITGCWLWQKSLVDGYGTFSVNGKPVRAHRHSYELFVQPIPAGMYILHTCDRRNCVNPAHLYAGNQKQNVRDCIDRGRRCSTLGEENGNAKLTTEDILEIRKDPRVTLVISQSYKISTEQVRRIKHKASWSHV